MDKIEQAIKYFNEEKYNEAENIAVEVFDSDNKNIDAVDVLAAIYLKTNRLNLLNNLNIAHLNIVRSLASFLTELKTYDQAIFFYQKAIELDKTDIVGLNNLALLYEQTDEPEKAKSAYEKSVRIKENYPALYNLGVLARKQKNLSLSKTCLQKALSIKPSNPYANYSLGMTYLMEKNFEKGYPYFLNRPVQNVDTLKNRWNGSVQKGKTLLVFCEYGLGDAIMFIRYLPFLKDKFKTVKVFCQHSLHSILKYSFPYAEFMSEIPSEYDFYVFSMDLPYMLNMNFDSIPFKEGYLKADAGKIKEYSEKYFNNNETKIGIFYVGGELEKRNAKYRRIPLFQLSKLLDIKGIKFYSFQKDDVFNELSKFPLIIDLGKTFDDFSDTAAAMKNLDLMITIDSAPVHLAGALGIKSYLMLPYYSEWRWFLDENKTDWYESVELIRQKTPCDWQGVVENIYTKLI